MNEPISEDTNQPKMYLSKDHRMRTWLAESIEHLQNGLNDFDSGTCTEGTLRFALANALHDMNRAFQISELDEKEPIDFKKIDEKGDRAEHILGWEVYSTMRDSIIQKELDKENRW